MSPRDARRLDGRFRIRQAALADLPELARVRARAWWPGCDENAPSPNLCDADIDRVARQWLGEAQRGGYYWGVVDSRVPADQGVVWVGVAHARAACEEGAPAPLELAVLHLLEVARGSGIADRLLQMAIGDAPAYLWLQVDNPRAAAFLGRHGFRPDGVTRPAGSVPAGRSETRLVRD
ncbi:GNAT family N-acetyltransferase [Aestuariimicrobium kwangyangense]|uniref:GNAT family N-acetyltransferase n=1 Tax=Aestuariimicrobium kwangyangense TaxID=396389 RepID=UPI0003B7B405|nr:GNAT family N-acetyltransferase [Aestuariimicrobium kwangyangense]